MLGWGGNGAFAEQLDHPVLPHLEVSHEVFQQIHFVHIFCVFFFAMSYDILIDSHGSLNGVDYMVRHKPVEVRISNAHLDHHSAIVHIDVNDANGTLVTASDYDVEGFLVVLSDVVRCKVCFHRTMKDARLVFRLGDSYWTSFRFSVVNAIQHTAHTMRSDASLDARLRALEASQTQLCQNVGLLQLMVYKMHATTLAQLEEEG